jgi:hypothetical protein
MGESTLGALLVVDGRVDVGVRPHLADGHERPLGSADVEQEVVDECDTRGSGSSSRHVGGESIH